jgi:hypothetical protein
MAPVEVPQTDGVRMYLPLLDGSDEVGVMALTLGSVDDDDRRLLRRLAGLVADMLVTKHAYTDRFFQARRREPMSVAAEMQWSLLPLSMSVPQAEVAGILEPAYDIAGDSLDYALNDDILHVAVIDAMGHGLDAATMATVAVGAYRHARRAGISLAEKYAFMDQAIAEQFGPDHFVTAQMMNLDIATGRLKWVNAGRPAPLLIPQPRSRPPAWRPGAVLHRRPDRGARHGRAAVWRGTAHCLRQPHRAQRGRTTGHSTPALPRPETGTRDNQ